MSPALSRRILKGIGIFVVVMTTIAMLRSTVLDWDQVPSRSMAPTILDGDRIYENKLAYDLKVPFTTAHIVSWAEPKKGDVVILLSPKNGQELVKRIAAAPGDVVDGQVIPAGKYFVMGDNRTKSYDSRSFGLVDRGQILGKAVGVIASFDPDRGSPRWKRFFTRL